MTDAYEVLSEERIEDVHAKATYLRHRKSGARVALLSNSDKNKVFTIGFRTPPENSTGVAHIIEHTVLCGSRKFPLKDPFVELVKGSLNTFLNAMTYPDKTIFPVASCNDTDFQNLMDVYLDAVFYPNIYKNEKIFRQEGWHYDLQDRDSDLTYNGVVYNEMKGAFSSADEVLDRTVFNTLFPDTPYGVESGGDPAVIPELTYEEFLEFHRKYYHPSNSYIYLYGDMDMEEKLDWLDREYLSAFDRIEIPSAIPMQKPFDVPADITGEYPILDDDPETDNTYLSENMVVGDYSDVTLNTAFAVLEYVLLDAPGAPVKQALLDAHIGKDIQASYNDGILQPFFSIVAKNANPEDKERFVSVIHDTLEKVAEEGIDQTALLAGINYFEFTFREADFNSFPKGLIYGINMYSGWLYSDDMPFDYLKQLHCFKELREKSGEGYFEGLIRKYLLDNPHAAVVTLKPRKGLAAEREAATAERLAERKASLSDSEIDQIIRDTQDLKAYQEAPETEEALASIPLLSRADIDRKTPIRLSAEETRVGDTVCLRHHYLTNGISYLKLIFDTKDVPDELVPYLGILQGVLGYVDTEHYTYTQLFHRINANTGGISCGLDLYEQRDWDADSLRAFTIRAKYLIPKQNFVFDIVREIIRTSKIDSEKRLREIISSGKAQLEVGLPAAGHLAASRRAMSYISKGQAFRDATGGIGEYRLLEELDRNFDSEKKDLIGRLQRLMKIIFRPENLTVSITSDEEGFAGIDKNIEALKADLFTEPCEKGTFAWRPEQKNEAFRTSGQVQYVALAGNYRQAGYSYSGAFRILRKILDYDYLWMNLRVTGGAYGCMSGFSRRGMTYLVSYRDPHLARTLRIYRELPDYLRKFDADERAMTKYIIGTISDLDTPLTASGEGSLALTCWFAGLTEDDYQKEREEILDAQPEDIRNLADPVAAVISENNICVIGSETAIEKDGGEFRTVESLN